LPHFFDVDALGALVSVVLIDVALAGDNAIVIGMAALGLPPALRRRAILAGIAIATALRIALASVAVQLLAIIGLTLAGGILLLGVAWKLFREIRPAAQAEAARHAGGGKEKTFRRALVQIVVADLSMSFDNVLAVAGTAREHLWVLVAGLLLSVALTGAASTLVAQLLARYRWISWLGLAIITGVALRMIYDGSTEVMRHVAALR
jgi:YjbE family integral membrane protein